MNECRGCIYRFYDGHFPQENPSGYYHRGIAFHRLGKLNEAWQDQLKAKKWEWKKLLLLGKKSEKKTKVL